MENVDIKGMYLKYIKRCVWKIFMLYTKNRNKKYENPQRNKENEGKH